MSLQARACSDETGLWWIKDSGGTVHVLRASSQQELDFWLHGLAQLAAKLKDGTKLPFNVPATYEKKNSLLEVLVQVENGDGRTAYDLLDSHQAMLVPLGLREELASSEKALFVLVCNAIGASLRPTRLSHSQPTLLSTQAVFALGISRMKYEIRTSKKSGRDAI